MLVTVPEMMSWTLVPALTLLFPLSEERPGKHFIIETEDGADGKQLSVFITNCEIKWSIELHSKHEHSHLDFIRLIFIIKKGKGGGWGVLANGLN